MLNMGLVAPKLKINLKMPLGCELGVMSFEVQD
jgi:hypothetical protein